jgi:hypothetical protein
MNHLIMKIYVTNFFLLIKAMFCDPNYTDPEEPESFFKGPYSHLRRCLYNKDTF